MNNQELKLTIQKATEMAIMSKMPEKTLVSIERSAVLLELFFFEWQNYVEALNIKIDIEDIDQFVTLTGLNKGQKRFIIKCANDHKDQVNKTVNQLSKLLKAQLNIFDKLPDNRMEELEQISNRIFESLNKEMA